MRVLPLSPKLKLRAPVPPRPLKPFTAILPPKTTETRARPGAEPAPVARPRPREDEPAALDTATRTAVLLGPPPPAPAPPAAAAPATPPSIPHQLGTELLDKASFWGDGERGVARLRFGSRARAGLAGATVTLEHDGEAMHLRVEDCDDPALIEQLREQLAKRGVILSEP